MEWVGDSSSQTQEIIRHLGSTEKCQKHSTVFLRAGGAFFHALVTRDLDEHKIPDIPLQLQKQDWGNVSARANIVW